MSLQFCGKGETEASRLLNGAPCLSQTSSGLAGMRLLISTHVDDPFFHRLPSYSLHSTPLHSTLASSSPRTASDFPSLPYS